MMNAQNIHYYTAACSGDLGNGVSKGEKRNSSLWSPTRVHTSLAKYYLSLLTTATLLIICGAPVAFADHGPYQKFYGEYLGETAYEVDNAQYKRDLSVSITPVKKGFNVAWKTTTHKPASKPKEKSYSIDFVSTDREHVYSSAMKANIFGGREALDPMKGDPYVWAKVNVDTLTIYALLVTDEGGYEMLVYARTLTATGLDLEFTRLRENEPLRSINASLVKQ